MERNSTKKTDGRTDGKKALAVLPQQCSGKKLAGTTASAFYIRPEELYIFAQKEPPVSPFIASTSRYKNKC